VLSSSTSSKAWTGRAARHNFIPEPRQRCSRKCGNTSPCCLEFADCLEVELRFSRPDTSRRAIRPVYSWPISLVQLFELSASAVHGSACAFARYHRASLDKQHGDLFLSSLPLVRLNFIPALATKSRSHLTMLAAKHMLSDKHKKELI